MTKYIQRAEYETTQLDDEWVVLNPEEFTITKLNKIGGYCWQLLRESQSVESIMLSIEKEQSPDEKVEQEDVEHFLHQLMKCGLVVHAKQ